MLKLDRLQPLFYIDVEGSVLIGAASGDSVQVTIQTLSYVYTHKNASKNRFARDEGFNYRLEFVFGHWYVTALRFIVLLLAWHVNF